MHVLKNPFRDCDLKMNGKLDSLSVNERVMLTSALS